MEPIKLLTQLIAIPSVNPAFLPSGHPHGGESALADFLEAFCQSLGLSVKRQKVMAGRSNLLASLKPVGKTNYRILLAPHMDTVPTHRADQLKPIRRNNRLYGRGACDTKGCIAVFLSTMARLIGSGSRPEHTEIIFAGLIDEEHDQMGSRALAPKIGNADLAIVGEPTQCRIITAHKGSLWVKLHTRGKAAHGARPHKGVNAVAEMAQVVSLIEGEYARMLKSNHHPVLGHATVNVGLIRGGSQANIVPDSCVIDVDRRTLPGETESTVRRELKALFHRHRLKPRISFIRSVPCDPMETDPSLVFVKMFMESMRQKKVLGVHYFCDASMFSAAGIPSVVFGPGNIDQAHTSDEWISISELQKAAGLLERFLRDLP